MARPAKTRTIFLCDSCGVDTPRWEGRCPSCGEWNTLSEMNEPSPVPERSSLTRTAESIRLSDVSTHEAPRLRFSSAEVDRVLGGGMVPGSLALIAGDPGIGKSTLLLRLAADAGKGAAVLYATGEESAVQVKMRADRMDIQSDGLHLLTTTSLDCVMSQIDSLKPGMVIVDSIQTLYDEGASSEPGSVAQIRQCTRRLMERGKTENLPILLSGHVTKGGDIAGPRVMEHMVDVVLHMEGDPVSSWRLLRSIKNRFGSTNEVGVFEMTSKGLSDVEDPSLAFIAERAEHAVGSVVIATLEGSRPLLAEVQALTSPSSLPAPRRVASGVDLNRVLLVCAVMGRRAGVGLNGQDIVVNVTGGLRTSETAADLGVALAIASSARDTPIASGVAAAGEVGLSGEVRAVPQLERRISEAARLGLSKFIVPGRGRWQRSHEGGLEVVPVSTLRQALGVALERPEGGPRKSGDE